MTTTELYTVGANGNVELYGEAKNAWRGCMAIWNVIWRRYLSATYVGPYARLQGLAREEGEKPGIPFMDDAELKRLWALGNDESPLEPYELLVLRTTFDGVLVKREDIPAVILAMQSFDAVHPGVTNLRTQYTILREIYDDPAGYGAVGWNQTTVNADAWKVACEKCGGNGVQRGKDCKVCDGIGARPHNIGRDTGHRFLEIE